MGNDYGRIMRNRIPSRKKKRRALTVLGVLLGAILVLAMIIAIVLLGRSGKGNDSPLDGAISEPLPSVTQAEQNLLLTPTGEEKKPTEGENKAPVSVTPNLSPNPEPVTPSPEPGDPPVEEKHIVVLDPGHGGRFYGACYNKKSEKDLNLSIALYTRAYLEEHYNDSITVYMTRETDVILDNDQEEDIRLRVEKAVEWEADIYVSFHMNATDTHKKHGAEVFCPHRESVKNDAFRLAEGILDELKNLGLKRNGYEILYSKQTFDAEGNALEGFLVNRYTADHDIVGIIIEHCYMDSEEDAPFIKDEVALQALGEADARGIAAYFGLEMQ